MGVAGIRQSQPFQAPPGFDPLFDALRPQARAEAIIEAIDAAPAAERAALARDLAANLDDAALGELADTIEGRAALRALSQELANAPGGIVDAPAQQQRIDDALLATPAAGRGDANPYALSDALYVPGPIPAARFDVGPLSLTVNGALNALNSVANSGLNLLGLVTEPIDRYQGELITLESNLGPSGGLLAGATAFAGATSRAIRCAGLANVEVKALTAAERSTSFQGVAPYEGTDVMRDIELSAGKRLAHVTFREDGRPISEYFTTESAIRRATLPDGSIDANRLNQGLQIYAGKDPLTGAQRADFKPFVQFYETIDAIPAGQVAFGRAVANPNLNPGSYPVLPQLFINKEFHQFLKPLEVQRTTNTTTPFYTWP